MRTILLLLTLLGLGHRMVAQEANTQNIRGTIMDEVSRSPLIGATVAVENSSLGTVTDLDGQFVLVGVPLGRQTLKITFVGYEGRTLPNVLVTAGKENVLEISLTESVTTMGEVVVTYDRKQDKTVTNNELTTVSGRSFNLEDTKRYAGSLGDPSRMAANFAGVSSGNDSRNDIVVRGNSPAGLLWQVDGLNIPNPNHFGSLASTGGPVSMLNNNVLDKSDFMTSAFPAQYGNANGGVFDLRIRNGNNQKFEFLGQVGFNGFEVGAEGPLGKKGGGSFVANYRYSTLGAFKALGFTQTGAAIPDYQDFTFKVTERIGKKSKLSFWGVGGISSVDFLGNAVDTIKGNTGAYFGENENTRVRFKTGFLGLTLETKFSDKNFGKLTLGASATDQIFNGDSISVITRQEIPSGQAKQSTQKYSAAYLWITKLNSRNSITSGATVDLTMFNLFNKEILNGTIDVVQVDKKDNSVLSQAYSQWKHRLNNQLSFTVGIHGQHISINNSVAFEPRFGARYILGKGQSLSVGYGLHSQSQNIYSYNVLTRTANGPVLTNKDLGFSRSHHVVLGYDWNITEHLRLKVESYYQAIFDAAVEARSSSYSAMNAGASFAPDNTDSLVNKGTGRNFGVELTLERYFDKGYYFLLTGSLFDSKYKGSDGVERNTAFNNNYVVNLLGGKEFKIGKKKLGTFAIDLRTTLSGGRPLTPLDLAASRLAGEAVYQEDKAFTERQKLYFRTDLKLSYRTNLKKMTMEFSVDLQNVTNNQNVFIQNYNRRTNRLETQYQQGFFPVPTFRLTF